MAATEDQGTQTAVVGTEHTLASPAANGKTRVLLVDVAALVATETIELRFHGAVLSAGTSRLIKLQTFIGVESEPHTQSPPFIMPEGGTVTLKQTTGSARSFPWRLMTLD